MASTGAPWTPYMRLEEPGVTQEEGNTSSDESRKLGFCDVCSCALPPVICAVLMGIVSVGISSYDLFTDCTLLHAFVKHEHGGFMGVLIPLVLLAFCLFFAELALCVRHIRNKWANLRDKAGKSTPPPSECSTPALVVNTPQVNVIVVTSQTRSLEQIQWEREQKLGNQREVASFFLLLLEDLPLQIFTLVFVNYVRSEQQDNPIYYCQLWKEVFHSPLGSIQAAVQASILSSGWKWLRSLQYCCCGKWYNIKGCPARSCYCCFRVFRSLVAFVVCWTSILVYTVVLNGDAHDDITQGCREYHVANGITTTTTTTTTSVPLFSPWQ